MLVTARRKNGILALKTLFFLHGGSEIEEKKMISCFQNPFFFHGGSAFFSFLFWGVGAGGVGWGGGGVISGPATPLKNI